MDHTGGYYMAMAILLALLHRARTGEGQWVDLACTEAALGLNGPALLDWSVNGRAMRETGVDSNRSQHVPMAPHGIYPCAGDDQWIAIACRDDGDWGKLADLVGAAWCADYPTLERRLGDQNGLDGRLGEWTARFAKRDLEARLRALPIPAAAVQEPRERIDEDPTTARFGLWPEVEHTRMGRVRVDGQPMHFSKTDWMAHRGAPCLGEHTEEVLTGLLGMTAAEVAALREEGVV
jgi:crotonobetainyl-CoA:carnitine CoA-transferase CaiB-like acyl-CoA transferase